MLGRRIYVYSFPSVDELSLMAEGRIALSRGAFTARQLAASSSDAGPASAAAI